MWSGHSCLLLLMLILMLISKIYRTPQIRGGECIRAAKPHRRAHSALL